MKNKYHIFFTGMLSIAFFMGATVDTKAQDSIAVVSRVNIEHLKAMPDLQLSNTLQGQAAGLIVIIREVSVMPTRHFMFGDNIVTELTRLS